MLTIRDANESDNAFLYATWLRAIYYGSEYFKSMKKKTFMDNYSVYVSKMLRYSKVKISCLADAPDVIVGCSVFSPSETVLHFVFVKGPWRKKGVATSLVPKTIDTVSSYTNLGNKIRLKKGIDFDPFFMLD